MRIAVIGNCDSARALRGDLRHAGFVLSSVGRFTIHIMNGKPGEILVDSIEGKIDRAIVSHLRELATLPLRFQTLDGIRSELEICIHVPPMESEQLLIEKAILRGLLSLGDPREPEPPPPEPEPPLPEPLPQTQAIQAATQRRPWHDWLPAVRRLYDRPIEN